MATVDVAAEPSALPLRKRKRTVEMKRIEDVKRSRVTFTKRRQGLFSKAQQLAALCDADVAVVAFSACGKPFSFGDRAIRRFLGRDLDGDGGQAEGEERVDLLERIASLKDLRQRALARADELAAEAAAAPLKGILNEESDVAAGDFLARESFRMEEPCREAGGCANAVSSWEETATPGKGILNEESDVVAGGFLAGLSFWMEEPCTRAGGCTNTVSSWEDDNSILPWWKINGAGGGVGCGGGSMMEAEAFLVDPVACHCWRSQESSFLVDAAVSSVASPPGSEVDTNRLLAAAAAAAEASCERSDVSNVAGSCMESYVPAPDSTMLGLQEMEEEEVQHIDLSWWYGFEEDTAMADLTAWRGLG